MGKKGGQEPERKGKGGNSEPSESNNSSDWKDAKPPALDDAFWKAFLNPRGPRQERIERFTTAPLRSEYRFGECMERAFPEGLPDSADVDKNAITHEKLCDERASYLEQLIQAEKSEGGIYPEPLREIVINPSDVQTKKFPALLKPLEGEITAIRLNPSGPPRERKVLDKVEEQGFDSIMQPDFAGKFSFNLTKPTKGDVFRSVTSLRRGMPSCERIAIGSPQEIKAFNTIMNAAFTVRQRRRLENKTRVWTAPEDQSADEAQTLTPDEKQALERLERKARRKGQGIKEMIPADFRHAAKKPDGLGR